MSLHLSPSLPLCVAIKSATAGLWEEELHAGEERREEHTLMTLKDDCGSRKERSPDPRRDGTAAFAADHLTSLVGWGRRR